jgi:hypothetical protein
MRGQEKGWEIGIFRDVAELARAARGRDSSRRPSRWEMRRARSPYHRPKKLSTAAVMAAYPAR